jgi:anti-sigma B factor antagonist
MGGAMTISTTGSDVVIAQVHARALDASNSRDFKSAMSPLLQPEAKLVFDLGELAFVDSTGLGALVSCLRHAHESKGEIKLCALNKPVRALFELVRMHRVFEIFNNPAEAVSSYLT